MFESLKIGTLMGSFYQSRKFTGKFCVMTMKNLQIEELSKQIEELCSIEEHSRAIYDLQIEELSAD